MALRSCWWNSWETPHPKCCSGSLIPSKGWVNRTPRQPCAQYFSIFTRSPECLQDFGKQSGKKPPKMLFFYPGIVFSQTFCQCWPSDTLSPIQDHSQKQLLQAAGGSRRRNLEKSLRFQGLRSPGQLQAMRSSTALNQPQDLTVLLFVNIISLLKEGK